MSIPLTLRHSYCDGSPTRSLILIITLLLLTGCSQPKEAATQALVTSPPFPTPMMTATSAPSLTATFTLEPSPSPSFTPQPSDTTQPATPTATATPLPPRSTPAPNQFTAGDDTWMLLKLEKRHAMEYQGFDFTPEQFNSSPKTYQFLVFTFECTSDASLISLLGEENKDLTSLTKTNGFPDIYVMDKNGVKYPVTIIEPCTLIATVSKTSSGFTPEIVARTIHRTATPNFP